jgi:hypothetical protein
MNSRKPARKTRPPLASLTMRHKPAGTAQKRQQPKIIFAR